jgi:DNA-directed RNA polymerase specialized sigma24 family protein
MDRRERFAELFQAEYPGLMRELGLILGDRALAEDVVADGFVKLWRQWDRVSALYRPGAWVRQVVLRKAGRARRRRGRRRSSDRPHGPACASPPARRRDTPPGGEQATAADLPHRCRRRVRPPGRQVPPRHDPSGSLRRHPQRRVTRVPTERVDAWDAWCGRPTEYALALAASYVDDSNDAARLAETRRPRTRRLQIEACLC